MGLYVGITDKTWYERLSATQPEEVNFWKPGGRAFNQLGPNEIFLFKLHAPDHFIVGGGFFVRYTKLPMSIAWAAFGENNGVQSPAEFLARIKRYRKGQQGNQYVDPGPDPTVGNIVLTQPFWLPREEWVPAPADWPMRVLEGLRYDDQDGRGYTLLREVIARLPSAKHADVLRERRAEVLVRLGQGGFRVVVTDAYQRRCAITGEATLDVLQAAHIRPYSERGPHELANGLLLRSDMHILLDRGLLTITPDLHVEVSPAIRELYCNGEVYYRRHGQPLLSLPNSVWDQPSNEYLRWHNEHVFRR